MMTNEEILRICGSEDPILKQPYWRKSGSGEFHETLTQSGNAAYESFREILIELEERGIITFDEDKLDEEFFGIQSVDQSRKRQHLKPGDIVEVILLENDDIDTNLKINDIGIIKEADVENEDTFDDLFYIDFGPDFKFTNNRNVTNDGYYAMYAYALEKISKHNSYIPKWIKKDIESN